MGEIGIGAGPPLVEVTRGEEVESLHRGVVVVADASGRVVKGIGNYEFVTFLRSAAKPLQLIPLIESGAAARFGFTDRELAVMAGSHNGEDIHLQAVASILAKIGLGAEALHCGIHYPFDRVASQRLREAKEEPSVLHNNCSGKHAGMLALALHKGHSIEDYERPGHPVQEAILQSIADFAGMEPQTVIIAVDGCGAPTFTLPMRRAALAYARLVDPRHFPPLRQEACRRVVQAMRSYPEMVGGSTGRLETELMRLQPNTLVAKAGAEGYFAIGVLQEGGGLGIAIKMEDGSPRGRNPVVIETLYQLGFLNLEDLERLSIYYRPPVKNRHGRVVGEIRARFRLEPRE
ncbi:MAG: asparaginase [Anaerolineae bacterium]